MEFANFIFSNVFILLFLPLWVAFLITLNFMVPSFRSKRFTTNLTLISTGICAIYSICLFCLTSLGTVATEDIFDWIRIENFSFSFGFLLDNLSAFFLILFTTISFFIQLYSYEYMKNDECFHRYFVYLNLFNFAISGLFISPNLFQIYIFLVLTGVCSYLLTSFWFKKKSVSQKSRQAYTLSKIGDCGLLLGLVLLIYLGFNYFPGFSFSSLNFSSLYDLGQNIIPYASDEGFFLICLILFIGIMAKSFQIPFHIKAIGTTQAPVPVGALINSATAVSSGVYLAVRLLPMFNLSSLIMKIVLYVGLITAIVTSVLTIFQNNIKKFLACITCSQLGLIFAVLGLYTISPGLLHLTFSAFAIALLFLLSGIIIVLTDTEDIIYMGGLRKTHPYLAACYLMGSLSLSGIFFSGIFSKIQLSNVFLHNGLLNEYGLILLSSFIISFCLAKSYLLIFESENKNDKENKDFVIHWPVKISVFTLLLPVLILGPIINKSFNSLFDITLKTNLSLKGLGLFITINVLSWIFAIILFKLGKLPLLPDKFYKFSKEGFFVSRIYNALGEYIYKPLCKFINIIDKYIIGGIEKAVSILIKICAVLVSKMQTGNLQSYLLEAFIGIIAAVGFIVFYYFKIKGF